MDILFPSSIYCICCGNIIDASRSYSLCDHCITHISWTLDGESEREGIRIIKCVDYGIYERSMIFSLKYDGNRFIAREIAKIMRDRLNALDDMRISEESVIVPVPIHPVKLFERGFNQAELIGKFLAKEVGIQYEDVLERNRYTVPMRGLGSEERTENVKGSIELKHEFKNIGGLRNKDIILVDDFFTTGSTARECAGALACLRPRSITFLAFAGRTWKSSGEDVE